jgi:hypothetical protein
MLKDGKPKLRLAVLLPLVQSPIALGIVMWNYVTSERPSFFTIFYRPVLTSICSAISAPAWIVSGLIVETLRFLNPTWSFPSVYRIPFDEVLFLICLAVLWFLVGCVLDGRRSSRAVRRRTWVGAFFDIFFVILGSL